MLVENSVWPIASTISVLSVIMGIITTKSLITVGALISLMISMYNWWKEVIIEVTYQGLHSVKVQKNLTPGFILFIISEAMVFFSLFFAFFYNFTPFPAMGAEVFLRAEAGGIPLLNTVILFMSGISVTASQHYMVTGNINKSLGYLFITIILGAFFLFLQSFEYFHSLFYISDSVYAASFYLLTGLHGVHVLIGVIYLLVSLIRLSLYHYSSDGGGFNLASLYYHFVDVVWIFLYAVIYCNLLRG